jgi:pimeloyl-ACP methyl ester carboxylesterase
VLVGYSWGSAVSLAARPDRLAARVLVAPPVAFLSATTDGVPTLALVPEHDQYGGPDAVTGVMGAWPSTTIEVVEGADHFVAGAVARISERVVGWVAALQ